MVMFSISSYIFDIRAALGSRTLPKVAVIAIIQQCQEVYQKQPGLVGKGVIGDWVQARLRGSCTACSQQTAHASPIGTGDEKRVRRKNAVGLLLALLYFVNVLRSNIIKIKTPGTLQL